MRFAAALLALVASAAVPKFASASDDYFAVRDRIPKPFQNFRGHLLWASANHIDMAYWVMDRAAKALDCGVGEDEFDTTCILRNDGPPSPLGQFYAAALRIDPHLPGPAQANEGSVREWLFFVAQRWNTDYHDLVLRARVEEDSPVAELVRLPLAMLDAAVRALASLSANDPFESHGRTLDALLADEDLFNRVYGDIFTWPNAAWTENHDRLLEYLLRSRDEEEATLDAYRPLGARSPLAFGF